MGFLILGGQPSVLISPTDTKTVHCKYRTGIFIGKDRKLRSYLAKLEFCMHIHTIILTGDFALGKYFTSKALLLALARQEDLI